MSQARPQPQPHAAFEWVRSAPIHALNLELQEFRHKVTGAPHIHLASDDDQNAFMVAFRTVPMDSTGVAHILEHTTLCGSKRYPVRDPFFMMTRRSLNTFMNAFTSSDWTAYPFASRNRKDFYNLMQVYLDATFFPTLDPLDFSQEGHRVEFEEPENPDSPLVFKGVVFNEMKGAMSSPSSALYQYLTEYLFPTVTYHYNSGGDPANIPDLSYEQLKAFHAHHYHPSNAIFMTFGNLPAHEHQVYFEQYALKEFARIEPGISVADEQRYSAPLNVETTYALDGEEETAGKSHIVVGWLLGRSIDPEEVLTGHLLSGVLLDNGASPLRHALETTELGTAPSPLCGLQDSNREMFFAAGVEGSDPQHAAAVEKLIIEVLEDIAKNGVDPAMVEAVLHQLELSQREISGDGFPYGLQLMVQALSPALHGADPVATLDIDPLLSRLREKIKDPHFIPSLVRQLLDNPHRVRLTMKPDTTLSAARAQAEAERLATMKAAMSEADKQRIIEQAKQLAQRQQKKDDADLLPKVERSDIPKDLPIPEGTHTSIGATPATWFARGTNGLVYQQIVIDLPEIEDELRDLIPMLGDVLTEVGSGGRSYLDTQLLQSAVTGGLGAHVTVRGAVDDLQKHRGIFVISGKALARNQQALAELMVETLESARFDELDRIHELISQDRMRREQSVTQAGHSLAMSAATAPLSPSAALQHRWHGLAGIKSLKALDDSLNDKAKLEAFASRLQRLRDRLLNAPRQLLVIGEEEHRAAMETALTARWNKFAQPGAVSALQLPSPTAPRLQGWSTSTQVNFCAKAYPAVAAEHPDSAALTVLAGFLRNNYLHRAIREQGGAYGGGASFDSDSGAFRFYSYRDPRLAETLADFDASISWLLNEQHEARLLEEAILGIIAGIDKPASPAGEAKKAFHAALHGRTAEQRRRFRSRVLEVTEADLKRVAATYLKAERATTAIVSNPATLEQAGLGLEIITL